MTSLSSMAIRCESCDITFKAAVPVSIDSWMDRELVEEFLNFGITRECPRCHQKIKVKMKVLISGRKGGNWLDNHASHALKLQKLIEWGAVDDDGKINS
ncbi:MAG: CpXC domain-containing protein [Promethearchaeota archaeon]